jgi:hypothetical protein
MVGVRITAARDSTQPLKPFPEEEREPTNPLRCEAGEIEKTNPLGEMAAEFCDHCGVASIGGTDFDMAGIGA